MKKTASLVIVLCLLVPLGCRGVELTINALIPSNTLAYEMTMKRDLLCLMMAYPGYITGVEREGANVHIVLKSGKHILYDDWKIKTHEGKIANPDLQDMMEQIYPLMDAKTLMSPDFDPGRARVYPLLSEVYGESKDRVQSNLVNIRVGYSNYQFNCQNNASLALESAMKELLPLAQTRSDIYNALFPGSGTFNYRNIAGANRLSPHSFGIAIDLARDKRDYWKWASRQDGQKRLISYPKEVVRAFERNNFIWGGKWGHFDILHFEYRPEIIMKASYFSGIPSSGEPWYDGVPMEDEKVKDYIEIIDGV